MFGAYPLSPLLLGCLRQANTLVLRSQAPPPGSSVIHKLAGKLSMIKPYGHSHALTLPNRSTHTKCLA